MISEEEMLSSGDFIAQGNVVEEEFVMGGRDLGSELRFDVVAVFKKFISVMREGENNCL